MTSPILYAATPQDWLDSHLAIHMSAYDVGVDASRREWLTMADLFESNREHLRASHERIIAEDGATAAAAAKWLIGWYPGRIAHAVGYFYAFASAAVIIDPQEVRFGRHPDGWTQLIDFGRSEIVVTVGHPWSGQRGVRVVPDDETLVRTGLDSLVSISQPIVEAVRAYAKVGHAALWSEVIDEFALACTTRGDTPTEPATIPRINAATRVSGMPWRKHPHIWAAETEGRSVHVGQKGGCCLAYQSSPRLDEEQDDETRAWFERFPGDARGRHYCNNCSLLAPAECQARQLSSALRHA